MLTSEDVKIIASKGEGFNMEFKVRVPQKVRDLAEEVCAFANAAGGYLLIGIDDKNTIQGVIGGDNAIAGIVDKDINIVTSSGSIRVNWIN